MSDPKPQPTAKELVDHWSWAADKGLMNSNTAAGLKAACNKVLSVQDEWESMDVRRLDIDDAFQRFVNLRQRDFKPKSLAAYDNRFRKAVTLFLAYVDDPAGWKPRGADPRPASKPSNKAKSYSKVVTFSSDPHAMKGTNLIEYPYPLREGVIARVILPRDVTKAELRRLYAFLDTTATDFDVTESG